MENEKKEITKARFKLIIWGLILIGLVITLVGYQYLFIDIKITQEKSFWYGLMAFGILLMGIGSGLAQSRTWRIKDYD